MGRRVGLLAAVALLASAQPVIAPPATAAPSVTVVDLPVEVRAAPRSIHLIGRTDSGYLVYDRQDDPVGQDDWHETPLVRSPDGTTIELDAHVVDVVGNRLIKSVSTSDPVSVTSRPVTETAWETLTVPDGATYLDYTSEGLLIRTGASGAERLGLLPWDGGDAVPIAGLPAGDDVWPVAGRVGHGTWSMLWSSSADQGRSVALLVDTATQRAWQVRGSEPDCHLPASSTFLGDGSLVWQETTTANGRVLCTTPLPGPEDAELGATTSRKADVLATLSSSYQYQLVPAGDDVLVAPWWAAKDNWAVEETIALRAIEPDGTVRTLASAAYGVMPAGPGHVLAVTGSEPGRSSVVDIDVAGAESTELFAVEPVQAWFSGIAVDGDRVYVVDDSGRLGGLHMRTVDFDQRTSGTSIFVDSDVTGPVTADGGGVAWNKSGWQNQSLGHRSADGTILRTAAGRVVGTDGRWVLDGGHGLLDSSGDQDHSLWSQYSKNYDIAFQDGVTYASGASIPGGPEGSVIATDATTRKAKAMPVQGCAHVFDVQVAGSWMLVHCKTTGNEAVRLVVDRSGHQSPWRLQQAGEVHLGNGFVVARSGDGELTWTALGGATESWQPLGTATAPDPPTKDFAVAVSRGAKPTVAWFSGRDAHVALLPVATSPLPSHPSRIAPPAAPTVSVVGVDRALRVTWPAAADSEHLTRHDVHATTTGPLARNASTQVPGSWTGVVFPGSQTLTNGATYDVTVTAWNIAGWTKSTVAQGVPVAPPARPSDVTVVVDPVTGRADVSWSFTPTPGTEQVRSFTVTAGDVEQVLPAGSRSTSFLNAAPWEGQLQVSADGAAQQNVAGVAVSLPGADTTRPRVEITGVPRVSLSSLPSFSVSATDNRQLADNPVDIRWRTATVGHRLGAWRMPARWQRRAPGTVTAPALAEGQTACFSARARDASGNIAPWSTPVCTTTPTDDRALTAIRSTRLANNAWFHGTASRLDTGGSQLQLTGPVAVTGWVLATTCPRCGRVQVAFGNTSFGSVNLYSARRHERQLLRIPGPDPQTGRLQLWLVNPRRQATIDAVVLQAH